MFVDYYELFDIEQDASNEEIKKAFRKKANFWHPDRNPGKDTTKEMQLINEAYLILKDDDARKRYDFEYIRFSSFRQQKKKETEKGESQNEQTKKTDESTKYTDQTFKEKEASYEYKDYSIFDETLKQWMTNAKKQAVEMAKETIKEFGNIAMVGITESAKGAGQGLIIQVCIGVLFLLIFSISKSCN
jgi:curved DNA-binding protein CbpA